MKRLTAALLLCAFNANAQSAAATARMSGYLIDTDWVIDYLHGVPRVVSQLQAVAEEGLAVSIVTAAELYEGVYASDRMEFHLRGLRQFLHFVQVIGLDDAICRKFGQQRCR